MAGKLEPLLVLWKGLGIQVMVLLSFAVQVMLLLLADVRRYKNSGVLTAIIWSAYVLADTTAIYALGHMALVSSSPEHRIMALWAPLLLVHLGGQDNITAYAIEDNRLWLRHLQTFGVQVLAVAYVLYVSSVLSSWTWLRAATILMFIVGVLKYGERVWALLCANNRASSSLSATTYKDFRSMRKRPASLSVLPTDGRDMEGLALIAYMLLDVPKQMFEGPTRYVKIDNAFSLEGAEILEVVLMHLSMMYDLLYTKAAVVHTWHGWCIRIFSLPATLAALLLFHATSDKDSYSRVDVVATYVLLGGAVVLEITSLVRAMCSSWTCALLLKGRWHRLAHLVHVLGFLLTLLAMLITGFRKRNMWGFMGQHNLFRLCHASRNNKSSKIARWMGLEDWWDSMFYSWSTSASDDLVHMVIQLVWKAENTGPDIANSRGRNVLRRSGLEYLEWSVELDLDESILVWHIATNLYLIWGRAQEQHERQTHVEILDFEQLAGDISNYMFFLLAARPYMLPYPVSRQNYVQLCYDAITSHEDLLGSIQTQVRAGTPGGYEDIYSSGSDGNDTLNRGCKLAVHLISSGGHSISQMSRMVSEVWVEMLCYTAYRCNENFHAKHLSDGGEVMTAVALLMLYMSSGLIKKRNTPRLEGTSFASNPSSEVVSNEIV